MLNLVFGDSNLTASERVSLAAVYEKCKQQQMKKEKENRDITIFFPDMEPDLQFHEK